MSYVLPPGIGDALWALLKIGSIAPCRPVDVTIAVHSRSEIDCRSLPFLRDFDFIGNVQAELLPIHPTDRPFNDERGRFNYCDGFYGRHHYLIPNGILERGGRIEDWRPEHPVNWNIMEHYRGLASEGADLLARAIAPYVVFYMGPESGNTVWGHNKGSLWSPGDWLNLGLKFTPHGYNILVTGAPWDRSYFDYYIKPVLPCPPVMGLWDRIGCHEIADTIHLIKNARCFVGFQSGLGVCAHYLDVPTVMWWRPDGDSCNNDRLVCFDERMKDSWTVPGREGRYLGLIYGRDGGPAGVMEKIRERGWL
jgi:hypothetical protein